MTEAKRGSRKTAGATARAQAPPLIVEVVWGDITEVVGDVYVAGHYEQVLPQRAELALDRVISGTGAANDDLVLTNLTRRGILRGALGDVSFFPWASTAGGDAVRGRVIAIAGMGRPGSFGAVELRRASRNVAWAVSSLPDARTVCTVLIGAGFGNLTLSDAVNGLMAGMVDAMVPGIWRAPVERLRIVERELGRARAIYRHLLAVRSAPEVRSRVSIELDDAGVRTERGGEVGTDYCMALTLAAAAKAAHGDDEQRAVLFRMLDGVQVPEDFSGWARKGLTALRPATESDLATMAARLRISIDEDERDSPAATRLSFVRDDKSICAAALTDTSVIPERRFEVDDALIAATVNAMSDPDIRRLGELSTFLTRLVVPRDFRELLERAPQLVVEVDRAMARLPWEMMSDRVDGSADARPVALKVHVARQLRTAYSPPPSAARVAHWPLRALVIGDPGDPAQGDSLVGARREALTVAQMLRAKGLDVTAMIGAASVKREGELRLVEPADRLDVLMQLMDGEYDLLHFAGHGDFDAAHPESTGWVFEGGLLTSRLLERVDLAPSLVVANACLSAQTSDALERGTTPGAARTESDLLPGLADEFFRRGVRNYVGTAWAIDDAGAVEFAKVFYDALIPNADERGARASGASVGEALLRARQALKQKESKYSALWAAYQHYGDPQHTLFLGDDDAR